MAYSQEQLNDIVDALIIDNNLNLITPAKVRQAMKAVISSLDQTNAGSVSATPPLNYDGFTNIFSILKADATHDGYLSKEDWTAFNAAAAGITPDATDSVKGKLKLTGDLGGSADAPTVPGLASKEIFLNKTDDIEGNKTSSVFYTSAKSIVTWVLNYLFTNAPAKASAFVDADLILGGDSADSFKTKTRTFAQLKATLKAYFDTLYATAAQLLLKQVKDDQVEISANSNVLDAWHGQTVLFTASCTITVPATLNNSLMFAFRTLAGVTVTWAITSPFTWETTPSTTTEKKVGHFMRRGSTNTIMLDM